MQFNILTKILSKIHRFKGTTIVQFGPPRSGTTLVYNILKDIFPERFVETRHYYRQVDRKFPTVVTYRNPLDSIISQLLIYAKVNGNNLKKEEPKLIITKKMLDDVVKVFEKNGIWEVLNIKNNKNVLMLKYEDFFNNFDVIFDKVEIFFKKKIDIEKRNLIKKNYNIESVEQISNKMKSYKEIDFKTLFHGDHINDNKGKPHYYKKFLKEEEIIYLENIYKKFLISLDYIS